MSANRTSLALSHRFSRRAVVQASVAGAIIAPGTSIAARQQATPSSATPGATPVAVSGEPVPELGGMEMLTEDLMARWGLPGAQLAISTGGRLVFDRGFGYAEKEADEAVQPDHRFRIASVSKVITTVAILRLVQAGKLRLDEPVFPLLGLEPPANAPYDPRLDLVTVEHLLTHAGGWNSALSGDPQYLPWSQLAASSLGESGPPSAETIIRFMLGAGLDFDPGTSSVYSNFGFNVLGRVIEKITGLPYEAATQQEVLAPAGITDMAIGKTRFEDRAEREVRYYQPPEYPATMPSVFPGEPFVPFAYGTFFMEAMDSHGGWIAKARDLLTFALAVDGTRGPALLDDETVTTMLSTPRPPTVGLNGAGNAESSNGLGWVIQDGLLGREWAHSGALAGSNGALLLRNDDGLALAFLCNTLPADFVAFFEDLRTTLIEGLDAVSVWPSGDLFENAG